ncbi:MAG: 50S ribosomal protein L29 [Candidatus Cloacimonas sp. 4484_209]|nr:MAG: 50S ribosomal protein L29 [Candidatus Cloacimonas sp. 4484_209]
MIARELRDKTDDELLVDLRNLYEELFNLRISKVSGNLTNPSRFKQVRKDIARIKTLLNSRRRQKV